MDKEQKRLLIPLIIDIQRVVHCEKKGTYIEEMEAILEIFKNHKGLGGKMKNEKNFYDMLDVKIALIDQLREAIYNLGALSDLLCITQSYGDTLSDVEVLAELKVWNENNTKEI